MIPSATPTQGLLSSLQSVGSGGSGSAANTAAQLGALPTASTPSGANSAASAVSQLGAGSIYDQVAQNYETKQLGLNAPVSSQDLALLQSGQSITDSQGQSFNLNSPVSPAQAAALGFSSDIGGGSGGNLQGYLIAQSAGDAFSGIDPNNVHAGLTTQYISEISTALQKAYPQLATQYQQTAAPTAPTAAQPVGVGPWGIVP